MSRNDVPELLSTSPDPPVFRRVSVQVADQKTTCPVRRCRCVVLDIPETAPPDDFVDITPGTVTAFVAREGDPLIRALTAAIEANNSREFNLATAHLERMGADFSPAMTAAAIHAESPSHVFPSFAEISYANKTLVGHVHIDDVARAHVHVFPYNGGGLDPEHFSMTEYCRPGADTPLICVFLIRQPILSDIEREALRLAPGASSAHNIEALAPQETMRVLVAMADAAARFVYNEVANFLTAILQGATALASTPDAVLQSEEFQKMLESLPSEMTAAELLRLRADTLLQNPRH